MAPRLRNHPPSAGKVVLVDFDGTIAPWGQMFSMPEPLSGVKTALRLLRDEGYTIVIFTSRLSPTWHRAEGWSTREATKQQREYITAFLEQHDIPFDDITAEKRPAVAYFDDKAMRVNRERNLLAAVRGFLEQGDAAV